MGSSDNTIRENLYIELAEYILLTENLTTSQLGKKIGALGLTFRKNKTIRDVIEAVRKARDPKKSYGKIEFEIDWLGLYLAKDVLKINKQKAG